MSFPRKDEIRRDVRECPTHGRTEFAYYTSGQGFAWYCMKCRCDIMKDNRRRKALGDPRLVREMRPKKADEKLNFCPDCHLDPCCC